MTLYTKEQVDAVRAAEPKDEKAELVSFRRVAAEIMADEHDTSENIVDALIRASAAARAEGYAQGHKTLAVEAGVAALEQELAAAKAEIERLSTFGPLRRLNDAASFEGKQIMKRLILDELAKVDEEDVLALRYAIKRIADPSFGQ